MSKVFLYKSVCNRYILFIFIWAQNFYIRRTCSLFMKYYYYYIYIYILSYINGKRCLKILLSTTRGRWLYFIHLSIWRPLSPWIYYAGTGCSRKAPNFWPYILIYRFIFYILLTVYILFRFLGSGIRLRMMTNGSTVWRGKCDVSPAWY